MTDPQHTEQDEPVTTSVEALITEHPEDGTRTIELPTVGISIVLGIN